MLDLQQLRYFVAVAEAESISHAAGVLHISQSPLSRQVIALETQLGVALFARARQRLKLTPAGQALLVEARGLLDHAQRVEQSARGETPPLVIGFVESAVHCGVLRDALQALRQLAPEARIELRNLRSAEQVAALMAGSLHLAFTHSPAPRDAGLRSERLADEAMLLALPTRHALAKLAVIKPTDLDGEGFIAVPASVSASGREAFLAACAQTGFTPRISAEAADPSVALGLVQAGVGLAMVQASLAKTAPSGVRCVSAPKGWPMRVEVHRLLPSSMHPLVAAWVG